LLAVTPVYISLFSFALFPRHETTTRSLTLRNNSVKDSIKELLQKYSPGYEGNPLRKAFTPNGVSEKKTAQQSTITEP
jgi:hypothetical protein